MRASGQAAVETAIVMPLQLFTLLGGLQLIMMFQARLVAEHAAYRAARAASLYRADCRKTVNAALTGLLPLMPGDMNGSDSNNRARTRYIDAATRIINRNRAPGVDVPLAVADIRITNRRRHFDDQLGGDDRPMRAGVRLTTLFELRIPFGGWLISRWWLASVSAADAIHGVDALMPTRESQNPPSSSYDADMTRWVREGQDRGYFTLPIVTTFTLRMMSDPLPSLPTLQRCK
jgi:hypothetical protein